MKATDAICGFKFFKKNTAESLIRKSSLENGWFFLIEILLRAEKTGIVIEELPVVWTFEKHTKVRILSVTRNYIGQMWKLFWVLKNERK